MQLRFPEILEHNFAKMSVGFNFFIVAILAVTATTLSAMDREPLSTSDATTVEHFTLGSTVEGKIFE